MAENQMPMPTPEQFAAMMKEQQNAAPVQRGMPVLRPLFSAMGLETPGTRFLGVSALAASVILVTEPSFAFTNHTARPFKLLSSDKNATWVPWYVAAVGVGVFASVFT